MAAALASLARNLDSFNEGVEDFLISNRNTTAPLNSLTVAEALQGLSDHKRNKEGALASLIENFRSANEDFEGSIFDLMLNMPDPVSNWTENFQRLNVPLEKAHKCLLRSSQIDEPLELPKRVSNETLTLPSFDYLEHFVNGASTVAPELSPFAQESSNAGRSSGVLPSSENLGLQGLSISDHKRNMAAALASLTENIQTVNEALEGLIFTHPSHKRNMAAALTNLIENFRTVNEALEGLSISDHKLKMPAAVPSLTENFHSVNVALEKAKEHLLQSVQNPSGNKDERRELSKLIMIMKEAELLKDNVELNYLAERVCQAEDKITKMTELNKETAFLVRLVDSMVQSAEGKCNKAPDVTQSPQDCQEFKNAGRVSWSPPVISKSWSPNRGLQECLGMLGMRTCSQVSR